MGLLRIRITSFLAGFGLGGGLALYQLKQDVANSHTVLYTQAEQFKTTVETRLALLENALSGEKQ